MSATAELFLTTGEDLYKDRLQALVPTLRSISGEQFGKGPGWTLVRTLPRLSDAKLKQTIQDLAGK